MQLAKATTLLASTYASCFLAMVMCADSVKAATFSLRGGDDNNAIVKSRFLIDDDEDVEILKDDVEGHYLVVSLLNNYMLCVVCYALPLTLHTSCYSPRLNPFTAMNYSRE